MAYFAVDWDGTEVVFSEEPRRGHDQWFVTGEEYYVCPLPRGTIHKLTGLNLTWNDDPIQREEIR